MFMTSFANATWHVNKKTFQFSCQNKTDKEAIDALKDCFKLIIYVYITTRVEYNKNEMQQKFWQCVILIEQEHYHGSNYLNFQERFL